MSLRYKIPVILLVVITFYALLSYGILRFLIFPSFLSLEKREARQDMMRCVEALRREIYHLDTVTHDWASWDDAYEFARRPNEKFIQSNLVPETFKDNRINVICIYDTEKNVIWGQAWNLAFKKKITIREFFPRPENIILEYFALSSPESHTTGIFATTHGPLIAAIRPIVTSDHQGPIQGYFLMGRFLKGKLEATLMEQTQVNFTILSLSADNPVKKYDAIVNRIHPDTQVAYDLTDKKRLYTFAVFKDSRGQPALLLKAAHSRDIYQKGIWTMTLTFFLICAAGIVMVMTLLALLRRIIILPLSTLTGYVTALHTPVSSEIRLQTDRKDEIGLLYTAFADMTERGRKAHLKLERINEKLKTEIFKRKKTEKDLLEHQENLRKMTSELLITEERERRRIAMDLHDRIGQNLALAQIRLDTCANSQHGCCPSKELDEISSFMENIIQDTRTLMFDISPPVLYEFGLEAAIEWLAEDLNTKHDICISFQSHDDPIPLEISTRISIYRAVRELLFNAVKHSNARTVTVRMQHHFPEELCIEVIDDGCGFDVTGITADKKNKGFGLFSLHERQKGLGGTIEINTSPGNGTHIRLLTPLHKPLKQGQGESHDR